MILSFCTIEKVKLYKGRYFVAMTVARLPNTLKDGFGPHGNSKTVRCDSLTQPRLTCIATIGYEATR
jgi:hypothetical protein